MNKDALVRVVKATRMSARLAETMRGTLLDTKATTVADEIYGFLFDALQYMIGDGFPDNISTSDLYWMIHSEAMCDGDVADKVWKMILDRREEYTAKPPIVTTVEMLELFKKNGGYMQQTPEGSWT